MANKNGKRYSVGNNDIVIRKEGEADLASLDSKILELFGDMDIDESKVTVKIKVEKAEKIKPDNSKLVAQINKITEALSRYDKSSNLKNTAFLYNNLIKLSDEALKLAKKLDYKKKEK